MEIISLVFLAIAVSIDGFWGGFAFGLRKIKINLVSLIIISSWSILCTMIAMVIGSQLKYFIPTEIAKFIGAALLVVLGIVTLKEGCKHKSEAANNTAGPNKVRLKDLFLILRNPLLADIDNQNDIKPMEGSLLGLAVAMDASIAAFTVSLMGANPYITPFLFGLTHFVLIGMGNIIARHKKLNLLGQRFSLLPGIILMVLGLLRLT